jgi:hypothetical protein
MNTEVLKNDELVDAELDAIAAGMPNFPSPLDPKGAEKIRQMEATWRHLPGIVIA